MPQGGDDDVSSPSTSSNLISTITLSDDDTAWWQSVAESCVRVTFAGFAGTLIGHAKEQQQQQAGGPLSTAEQDTRRRPVRKAPPRAFKRPKTNLPVAWGLGCTMFVLILETSRRTSPTTMLADHYADDERDDSATVPGPSSSGTATSTVPLMPREPTTADLYRAVWTAAGDFALGGTVAGMAGALAQRKRQLPRATAATPLWSLTLTGMCFGLFAGLIQGGADAGAIVIEHQKAENDRLLKEEEDMLMSEMNEDTTTATSNE